MADEADLGRESEEHFRALALARWRAGAQAPAAGRPRRACVACGDPIPAARRRAVPGVTRCVECQAAAERARP